MRGKTSRNVLVRRNIPTVPLIQRRQRTDYAERGRESTLYARWRLQSGI